MRLLSLLPLLAALFTAVLGERANGSYEIVVENPSTGFWNLEPPIGVHLSGIYKGSFAYNALNKNIRSILTKTSDRIDRDEDELVKKYGADSREELRHIADSIRNLTSELTGNKQLTLLPLTHTENDRDALMWNDCVTSRLELEGPNFTWFFSKLLFSECYAYRRLSQMLVMTKTLKAFDPFEKQKQDIFTSSIESVVLLAEHTNALVNGTKRASSNESKREFEQLLKLSLWSNRLDLSASGGEKVRSVGNPVELLNSFESDILINDAQVVWDVLTNSDNTDNSTIVDVVLDNAGYEFFTDLSLASFLVARGLAHKVRFHVKQIPWFVSDVNLHDFTWTVDQMLNSSHPELKAFGRLCAENLRQGIWTIEEEPFWTTFHDFGDLRKEAPALYEKLSNATLIIFKGDLNYRKLVGDINWNPSTSLDTVLYHLDFKPTNIVSLRTVKSSVCVGLTPDKERLWKKEKIIYSGKFGVIHASLRNSCACPL